MVKSTASVTNFGPKFVTQYYCQMTCDDKNSRIQFQKKKKKNKFSSKIFSLHEILLLI